MCDCKCSETRCKGRVVSGREAYASMIYLVSISYLL